MYAIVRIGGKQYTAEVGKTIITERLNYNVGDKVEFEEVLLISGDGNTLVGQPLVSGGLVKAEVVDQFKGKKIVVFKYKPKQRYRRKMGHRQQYTRLMVSGIVNPSQKRSRSKKTEEAAAAEG